MEQADPIFDQENLATSFSFLADSRSCLTSPELRRALRTARTWVLTLAVFACCWFGLAILLLLAGTFMSRGFGSSEMLGFVFMFSVVAVVLGIPVALMFQFATRTRRFLSTASLRDLVSMLQAQRWMWTVLGIYGLLVIILNIVALSLMAIRFNV